MTVQDRKAAWRPGVGLLLVACAASARSDVAAIRDVPDALKVPAGQVLVLAAHGVGVQIYACTAAGDDPAAFSWNLQAPAAELRDASGKVVGRHFAGPSWEAIDGSRIVGEVTAKSAAPDGAAIPWLLLRAKSTYGGGAFGAVQYIQRLHTTGGKPPAAGCDRANSGREARVDYAADYFFYAAPPP